VGNADLKEVSAHVGEGLDDFEGGGAAGIAHCVIGHEGGMFARATFGKECVDAFESGHQSLL
jgi:hypothetical protein